MPSFEAENSELPATPIDLEDSQSKSDDDVIDDVMSEDFGVHSTPIPVGTSNQLSPGKASIFFFLILFNIQR